MSDKKPARSKAAKFSFFSLLDAVRERFTPQLPPECEPSSGRNEAHRQPSKPEGRTDNTEGNGIYESLAEAKAIPPDASDHPAAIEELSSLPPPEIPEPLEIVQEVSHNIYRGPSR